MAAMRALPDDLSDRLIESVPNVSEGRRLDVVDRLAAAVLVGARASTSSTGRATPATTAPSSRSRAGRPGRGRARGARRRGRPRHRHGRALGRAPPDRRGRRRPVRPARRHDDGRGVELARRFGARVAERFDLPVYLYARAARRTDRVKLADVRRGQYEGLKAEIAQHGREPDLGPARMHPSAGAMAVGARPFLIAYNINLDTDDVELAKRIARRVRESGGGLPKVQANGFSSRAGARRSLGPRPGLDEPPRLPRHARSGGSGRPSGPRRPRTAIELARVGADRAGAARGVPGRRRSRRCAAGRPGRGAARGRRGVPEAAGLHPDAGPRAPARGRRAASRAEPATVMSLRLDRRAAAATTDAAGPARRSAPRGRRRWPAVRGRGADQGDVDRRGASPAARGPNAPVVALLGGPIVGVGRRADRRALPRGRRATRSARFARARRGRRDGDARARRPAHPPAVRRQPRGRAGAAPARRRLPRDPGRGRRHPLDGRGDPRGRRPTTSPPTAGAGSTRCSPTASRRSRRSPATASTSPTELRLLEVAYRLGAEGPIDVVPTFLGAHAVPPEFRGRPDGTEAYVRAASSRSSSRASPPRAARASATSSARRASSRADQSSADPRGGGRPTGCGRGSTPTSWPRRGGAELAAELGALSADHLATPSERRASTRWRAAAGGRPPGRRHAAAGDDLVPDEGPPRAGAAFIERGVPVAIGTDFNPGTSPTASLPLAMTVACLLLRMTPDEVARGGDDQRGPGARARRRDRLARGRQAGGPRDLARADVRPDPVLAGAPTSSGRS